jgi:hypothetical protein
MVNQSGGDLRPILVDNGKRRTIYHIRNAQCFTNRFDESGFARSHLPVESENRMIAHPANKFFSRFADGFQIFYLYQVHLNYF